MMTCPVFRNGPILKKLIVDDALTSAELKVIDAAREGEAAWLGETVPTSPNKAVLIRAPLLRYLILGGCADFQTEAVGVYVVGGWIKGTLDLNLVKAKGMVTLLHCYVAQPIEIAHAKLFGLNLSGSTLEQGLIADGSESRGAVVLQGTLANAQVRFTGAKVRGQLNFKQAILNNPSGVAIHAQSVEVDGDVYLKEMTANGGVSLSGVVISGQLNCTDAKLIHHCEQRESLEIVGAERSLMPTIHIRHGVALNAEGAQVGNNFYLRGVVAEGEVVLANARIAGQLECDGATFNNPFGPAFKAQHTVVKGGFYWRNICAITGRVDLNSAHFGRLVSDSNSWGKCEELWLTGMTYNTLPSFSDVGESLELLKRGSTWNGEFHPQPYEQLAKVLRETGHRAEASAVLVEKEVQQRAATRERWRNERQVRRNLWRRSERNDLTLSEEAEKAFVHFTTQDTVDRYKVLHPAPEHPKRDALLITGRYDISPYMMQQAQRDFRNQQRWSNLGLRLKIGGHWCVDTLLRGIVGYGYRPQRSFYALLCLIGLGWFVAHQTWEAGDFAPNSDVILSTEEWQVLATDDAVSNPALAWSDRHAVLPYGAASGTYTRGRDYETFNAFYYSIDTVIPIISLGQEAAWAPSTNRGPWGSWFWGLRYWLTILGWIVTAIGAAAVTGIIRKD